MARLSACLASLIALALAGAAPAAAGPPLPVQHVFVIVLENQNFATTFGPGAPATSYLARTLPAQGQLLTQYYGVAHESFPNYVAMVSGQGANVLSQADCPIFLNVVPGNLGPDGQAMGLGCVYPPAVKTVADQLQDRGLSWKAYLEDMEKGSPASCRHPPPGGLDTTQSAKPGDQYAARHNPFVYFHSIIDTPACAAHDVPLTELAGDLAADRAPSYALIVPNLCHDGHDHPCVTGELGGLTSADATLHQLVPMLMSSRAYKDRGLIVITFDEAEDSGAGADASACCDEPAFPNAPNNGGLVLGRGGGRIGAVLLSRLIRPGTVNDTPYNHFALLRTVEDLFGLPHLGYAARPTLRAFGDDVWNGPRCLDLPLPAAAGGRFARGTLIGAAAVRGHRLTLTPAHGARLRVQAGGRRHGPRRVHPCRTYTVRLPHGHGRVLVRERVRAGVEERRLRY